MELNYKYRKSGKIDKYIIRIEVAKKMFDLLPQLPHIEENLRHKSLLKSSLFSAKIEGNRLELFEVQNMQNKTKNMEKREVLNILNALKWIYSDKAPKKVSSWILLKLHEMVLSSISQDVGKFRKEPSAIFNQAGVAIYMTPPPSELESLINQLIKFIQTSREHPAIKTAIAHFCFEKIHPFIDGNGRVGRLLIEYILKNTGYGFRGLTTFEEYLLENRQEYYDLLASNNKDITSFILFFLEAIAISSEQAIEELKDIKKERPEDLLLPRRREILAIISDHETVTFDFIKRRFYKIPASSLHYDLKMLLQKGFIKKLGSTRGVFYAPK